MWRMAIRPPFGTALRRTAAHALAAVARSVGTLLLLCGTLLVVVGLGVRLSRQRQLAADERLRLAPRFEDTVGQRVLGAEAERAPRATGAAVPPAATAPPTTRPPSTPGAKRVADRGPSVSLAPRVVVFGAADERGAASATPLRRFGKGRGGAGQGTEGTEGTYGTYGIYATPTPEALGADSGPGRVAAPDRILIQSIGVDRPVVPIGWTTEVVDNATLRSVWRTADDAAGWHETSAPLGGVGNTVVSGHNNIAGAVFRSLHELAVGDTVTLRAGAAEIRYAVERTFIVQEDGATDDERRANNRWIEPTDDERLTLVTCYPPWGNTHRLIVIARPVVYILPTAVSDAAATRAATGEVR